MNIENNRLPKPAALPAVEAPYAEAVAFYEGWWSGIVVGAVIGLGAAVGVLA